MSLLTINASLILTHGGSRPLSPSQQVAEFVADAADDDASAIADAQEQLHQLGVPRPVEETPQAEIDPKKWHIGTGSSRRFGRLNYASARDNNSGYISCCTDDWRNPVNGKPAPGRTKQFEDFKTRAKKGDIMYLHHKLVSHWGVYTGEILSHREGYKTPVDPNPRGWAEDGEGGERLRDQFHIKVDLWRPLAQPFKMKKRNATLFEVTRESNYIHS